MSSYEGTILLKSFRLLEIVLPPLATLLAGYIGVRYGLKQIEIQRRFDFVERQLREFYSPLLGYLRAVRAKSALRLRISNVADEVREEISARRPEGESEQFEKLIKYDNQQLRQELLPLYRKMLEVFREHYYLAEPETVKWYTELSDFIDLWDRWLAESIPREVIQKLDHTEERLKGFYAELELRHNVLRQRLPGNLAQSHRHCGHIKAEWVSAIATVCIAVFTGSALFKIENVLNKERIRAVENHHTWVEMSLADFESTGERDPKDLTSTFWRLWVNARNLGKETAFVHVSDWTFQSEKRGAIKKADFPENDLKFSLPPGKKAKLMTQFVMSPEYHIPALISGEDALVITYKFESRDMKGEEEGTYEATWRYTKGKFSLLHDERRYQISSGNRLGNR